MPAVPPIITTGEDILSYHLTALVIAAIFSVGYVVLAVIAWPWKRRANWEDEGDDW